MQRAVLLVRLCAVYGGVGVVFGAAFVSFGLGRVDPAARAAPLGLRLLLWPGSAALWPLLLVRWLRGSEPPTERTAHRENAP